MDPVARVVQVALEDLRDQRRRLNVQGNQEDLGDREDLAGREVQVDQQLDDQENQGDQVDLVDRGDREDRQQKHQELQVRKERASLIIMWVGKDKNIHYGMQ